MWHMLSLQVHAKFPWHHTSKAQQNHRNQIWKISTCFCLKKFPLVCDWVKLTACCKWAQFQLRNWGKGEAGNSSQEWNVLPSTNAKGVLKYMKGINIYIYIYFKNNTMNWSMGRWSDQVLSINLRFSTDPITGNVGVYTNHLHRVPLQSLSQGSVALY